ncbi:gibberellin 2-beta-dioxygenase 8 [Phtheirospermum japonicum]|uniref:Gibberellin 2-beta-dioxygenase 8 n=1 Tax=Phtheirospermum japonicum TaxID=374723 RepID=A0A830DH94_9LAMI|nr:gibberellin 2-beta-dioxygenase 8 [Phtheirospermum japonicum]
MPNSDNNIFQSYPPFFRPNQHYAIDHGEKSTISNSLSQSESTNLHISCPNSDSDSDSQTIPVIDFQGMGPENLGQVCREWGMFRLVNHGVPMSLLTQLHEKAHKIFNLGFDFKQGLLTNPVLYFWGSPAISLSGTAGDNLNWLEGLNVPLDKTSRFQYEDPLLQSFRSLLEEYGSHQTRLAKAIFRTIAQDLKFPPTKLKSYLSTPTGFLRVYRYLRCPMEDQRWGINAHTDSSVFSILHQDQVGGLQVYKNNKWLDVKPIRDTLIVNLGDMMQAMSNDSYISVAHRVKVNRQKERISIGYFVFPAENAVIESTKYKPFTYTDFQAEKEMDLKTVGKKIGLPKFRKDGAVAAYHWLE